MNKHIPVRTLAIHASALLIAAACAEACSSAPQGSGEAVQSTEQAVGGIPSCGKGYIAVSTGWDVGPTGKPIESWACEATAALHTGGPAGGSDTCGALSVPTPASLPYTCTLGTVIDGQVFFACPTGTVPPASLGLVSAPAGLCSSRQDVEDLFETCESVEVVTSLSSNCLGSPQAGWVLVVDATEVIVPEETDGGGSGGPCPGGCAVAKQAPLSN